MLKAGFGPSKLETTPPNARCSLCLARVTVAKVHPPKNCMNSQVSVRLSRALRRRPSCRRVCCGLAGIDGRDRNALNPFPSVHQGHRGELGRDVVVLHDHPHGGRAQVPGRKRTPVVTHKIRCVTLRDPTAIVDQVHGGPDACRVHLPVVLLGRVKVTEHAGASSKAAVSRQGKITGLEGSEAAGCHRRTRVA